MNGAKRLQWIDSLRITAMIMIIVIHICFKSRVIYDSEVGSAKFFLAWLLESFSFCAVNCYALITGYVMAKKRLSGDGSRFRYSRIIPLWLQVFYYSAIITVLFKIFMPHENISLIAGFTPLLSSQYWYFNAYFGMFFFIPFMNILIEKMTKKEYILLLSLLFVIFSFIPFMSLNADENDLFGTVNGHSTVWLMILYFYGAFIRLYGNDIKVKKRIWAVLYMTCSVIPALCSLFVDIQSQKAYGEFMQNTGYGGKTFLYTSPFTVTAAISLFMLFKDKEIKSRAASAIINFLAPASFSVFLIHYNDLFLSHIMKYFDFLNELNAASMTVCILLSAVIIFFVLGTVDHLRIFIFRLLKVNERSDALIEFTVRKLKGMRLR